MKIYHTVEMIILFYNKFVIFLQTVKLSFDFPFYGHTIKNVTIATGGFLYTGDYIHSWLAATQYIAPLMANFDTSLSNDSFIKYVDNGKLVRFSDVVGWTMFYFTGTAFTVEWEKVSLQDKPNEGTFTFQVTLLKSGDVVFVYQNVPLFIENIKDDHHPVKVGMSDAYIMDRQIFCKCCGNFLNEWHINELQMWEEKPFTSTTASTSPKKTSKTGRWYTWKRCLLAWTTRTVKAAPTTNFRRST